MVEMIVSWAIQVRQAGQVMFFNGRRRVEETEYGKKATDERFRVLDIGAVNASTALYAAFSDSSRNVFSATAKLMLL